MRVTLRIVSGLTLLCIPAGIALILANGVTGGDVSPLLLPGFACILLGVLTALTTALLGIVASAMRRQVGWLIVVIVVLLIPIIGIPVVETLAGQVDPSTASVLAGTAFPAFLLGGPIVLALVVLVYSFFLGDPVAAGALSKP
jgi:hypothetical protein